VVSGCLQGSMYGLEPGMAEKCVHPSSGDSDDGAAAARVEPAAAAGRRAGKLLVELATSK
jgi:hypothetical protein